MCAVLREGGWCWLRGEMGKANADARGACGHTLGAGSSLRCTDQALSLRHAYVASTAVQEPALDEFPH